MIELIDPFLTTARFAEYFILAAGNFMIAHFLFLVARGKFELKHFIVLSKFYFLNGLQYVVGFLIIGIMGFSFHPVIAFYTRFIGFLFGLVLIWHLYLVLRDYKRGKINKRYAKK